LIGVEAEIGQRELHRTAVLSGMLGPLLDGVFRLGRIDKIEAFVDRTNGAHWVIGQRSMGNIKHPSVEVAVASCGETSLKGGTPKRHDLLACRAASWVARAFAANS
jgi:hypothetical protein